MLSHTYGTWPRKQSISTWELEYLHGARIVWYSTRVSSTRPASDDGGGEVGGLDVDKRRVNDHVYCSHSYVYLTTTALIAMHIASTSRTYVQLKPQWWERLVGSYTSLWDGRKREEGARGEEKAFHPKCRVDLLALASVNSWRNTRWLCYICKHGHRCTGI